MPKFVNILQKPAYFEQALFLYKKSCKFMDDDYAKNGCSSYDYFSKLVLRTQPFFYVFLENEKVIGLAYLDNLIGDSKRIHSAELSTCFDRNFWGDYTKICSIIFVRFCFDVIGLTKIKALVYPENFRVKGLLEFAGFKKEALLKDETLRNNKLQDIEIYSCRKVEK